MHLAGNLKDGFQSCIPSYEGISCQGVKASLAVVFCNCAVGVSNIVDLAVHDDWKPFIVGPVH